MKSKKIFLIVFMTILITLSSCIIGLYGNMNGRMVREDSFNYWQLESELQYYIIAKTRELDPDYELISWGKDVPSKAMITITDTINDKLNRTVEAFEKDSNFGYYIKNLKTNKVADNKSYNRMKEKDKSLDMHLKYDAKGSVSNYEKYEEYYAPGLDLYMLLQMEFDVEYVYDDKIDKDRDIMYYIIGKERVSEKDIKVNKPKDLEVHLTVPKVISHNGEVVDYLVSSKSSYYQFAALAMIISALIMGVFILVYPFKTVEQVGTFAFIKRSRSEVVIFVLGILVIFGSIIVGELAGASINGKLVSSMVRFNLPFVEIIKVVLNCICWSAFMINVALVWFYLKYIIMYGPVKFVKERTIIGYLGKKAISPIHEFLTIDFTNKLYIQIILCIISSTILMIILSWEKRYGHYLMILYSIFVTIWVCNKIKHLIDSYKVLLNATKGLGEGNIGQQIIVDAGAFNEICEAITKIQLGLEKAVREETKSQNMKTELITNVSHDLKTPLTCILNYVELLKDSKLEEDKKIEYINNVSHYSNRLNTLIEDLFEVSKVNSGNIELDLIDLNVVSLIEQVQTEYLDVLEKKGLQTILTTSSNEIIVNLDSDKTYRVFANLFANIGKYAMEHTRVYIDIKEDDNQVEIQMKNISKEPMNFTNEEIVERFVRGDKSRHENGSGLGLAIVKSFTDIQKGDFNIDIDGDLFKTTIVFPKI